MDEDIQTMRGYYTRVVSDAVSNMIRRVPIESQLDDHTYNKLRGAGPMRERIETQCVTYPRMCRFNDDRIADVIDNVSALDFGVMSYNVTTSPVIEHQNVEELRVLTSASVESTVCV